MDKYGRTYHFPFSPGATNDDKILTQWTDFLQFPLVITEKLDGENSCLKKDGVYARSHAAPTRNPWAANMWELWERLRYDVGDWHIFGENLYGLHSIEYQRLSYHFFVFSIREGDHWLPWDEVVQIADLLDLPTVPVFERGIFTPQTLQEAINAAMQYGSAFGDTAEGFVVRNENGFSTEDFKWNVLKYVRENHVQTDEHWTRNWRRAPLWFEPMVERR